MVRYLACPRETTGTALQATQGVACDGFPANRVLSNLCFAPNRDFFLFFVVFLCFSMESLQNRRMTNCSTVGNPLKNQRKTTKNVKNLRFGAKQRLARTRFARKPSQATPEWSGVQFPAVSRDQARFSNLTVVPL